MLMEKLLPTVKPTGIIYSYVDNLNQTKYVIISVDANTSDYSNQQSVKIYEDYKLEISCTLCLEEYFNEENNFIGILLAFVGCKHSKISFFIICLQFHK